MDIKEFVSGWGMLILSVILNATGIFVFKVKMNELGPIKLDSVKSTLNYFVPLFTPGIITAGFLLFIVAPLLAAVALSRMELTVLYPAYVVLNFVILVLLAIFFLGESITLVKAGAIALALMSTFLLCRN